VPGLIFDHGTWGNIDFVTVAGSLVAACELLVTSFEWVCCGVMLEYEVRDLAFLCLQVSENDILGL
jgi:hypothetical protein